MAQSPLIGGDFWTATRNKVNANTAELYASVATGAILGDANKTLVNDIRAKLKGDYNVSLPALAIGSTTTAVANVAFDYTIGGIRYSKAAVTAGTAPGDDVIPEDTFGAVALDIDAAGTITVAEAADNATGYASAVLAIAGIPAVASGKARMGTVTASGSEDAFTFGTTALNAADTTVAYTDGETHFQAIGAAVA